MGGRREQILSIMFHTVLFLFGLFAFGSFVKSFLIYVGMYYFPKRKVQTLGEFVVITGATDGIGKAIAMKLAIRNVSLALIGRNQTKLNETEKEIKALNGGTYKGAIETIRFDFSSASPSDYAALEKKISSLSSIGLLINNVGISYRSALYLTEVTPDEVDELISVNLKSTMRMSQMVYARMKERKSGAILCMGSGASCLSSEPLYAAYAGVKGGVEAFCRSFQAEAKLFNVLVQCQVPLLVTSKLSKVKRPSLMIPSAEQFAISSIRILEGASISGLGQSPTSVSPYFLHYVILTLANCLPVFLWDMIRASQTLDIRRRYLKKMEAESKQE